MPGDPPSVDPAELTFLPIDTRTPYVADFPGEDGGNTARYMVRWISSCGRADPWSEPASGVLRCSVGDEA